MFGRISHYRAWIESHMNHSSNYFCDGGLDARDIQPECECGGVDGVEVSTRARFKAIFCTSSPPDVIAKL